MSYSQCREATRGVVVSKPGVYCLVPTRAVPRAGCCITGGAAKGSEWNREWRFGHVFAQHILFLDYLKSSHLIGALFVFLLIILYRLCWVDYTAYSLAWLYFFCRGDSSCGYKDNVDSSLIKRYKRRYVSPSCGVYVKKEYALYL